MFDRFDLQSRIRATGIHLLISAAVGALAGALVFGLWYPGAYRLLAGGRELFLLVAGVDVVLGPVLTFAVFNPKKGWAHLRRDLAVVGLVQFMALAYGISTVYEARPVALVFEVDRFRVITANEVFLPELGKAPAEYRALPLVGPWLLGTRAPDGVDERNEALFMGVNGVDLAQRPTFWRPYSESTVNALSHSRPLHALISRYPDRADEIRLAMQQAQIETEQAKFIPVTCRSGDWVAILDATGRPVHFIPVDGFF